MNVTNRTTAWLGLVAVIIMSAAIFLGAEYLSIVDRPVRVAKVCAPNGECADVSRYTADGGDAVARWLHRDDPAMVASGFYGIGFWGRFPKSAHLIVRNHDCADNKCTVSVLYDQSGHGNDMFADLTQKDQPHLVRVGDNWAVSSGDGLSISSQDSLK